ncbi:MAG: hypothetical protein RLZZ142_457 [Verrucomicrobiota bacterium]
MTDSERQLVDLFLDGGLPESEHAILFERLESDPEALAYLAERSQLHVDLRRSFTRRKLQHLAVATAAMPSPGNSRALSPLSRISWRGLAAAAAVLAVGFATLWQGKGTSPVIAHMRQAFGARWENCTLPTEPDSPLGPGRLRLAEGLATLRFARGAEVTLEGPAELELIGEQICRLHRGSLVAHVPEPARGFSVLTPSATLIDHGTDFGIRTDARGNANVHVMQGAVELRHANGKAPVRLITQEMTAITPQQVLPVKRMEAEPRLPLQAGDSPAFTSEVSTRSGGGTAFVSEVRGEGGDRAPILFLKNSRTQTGYGRKVLFRFDLSTLPQIPNLTEAQLTFTLVPTGSGYAARANDAHLVAYALTDAAERWWNDRNFRWDQHPAFDPDPGRVDGSRAVRVGEITVPRGVQSGSFSIRDARLTEFLRSAGPRSLTFIVVRENPIEEDTGLVLGIAGNHHPTLPAPTLSVR